ncbi:growth factor receptor domain-containing [Pyrrhoderma noxium]|uniref:Growth factor receptor domain-containing n=1 Tax=Pyrrhoderma noxium TaxID=2282107 RepID=A0A286UU54_9AGAM|nr:growth factor receptor domain-containing [Pyrrhoderma noxium]
MALVAVMPVGRIMQMGQSVPLVWMDSFFSDDGSCRVCQLGCSSCLDSTGIYSAYESGFTLSSTDSTKCTPQSSVTSTRTVCTDGSFSGGTACTACNALCSTCTGSTGNDCIVCGSGRYKFNGSCVNVDSNGVCQAGLTAGNGFVADNNKKECEACPEKCTACGITSFTIASTIDQAKCTSCLPGFVLSSGQCVESCPNGSFLDPKDNTTCSNCDSTCSTCANSFTTCLTCANNLLASGGTCVTSCPSGTFSSSGACVSSHTDCATCTGTSFNHCPTCPSSRPVLSNGRCLPVCSKAEFFDSASGSCKSCDSSCASCSGDGGANCLSCANDNNILRSGRCVSTACESGTSVVNGLGICLSDLVAIPQTSSPTGTSSGILPSITGIDSPIVEDRGQRLEWWQIFLMALGCAFVILVLLLCWRRQARKRRLAATQEFARQKQLDRPKTWRERVIRFGERLYAYSGRTRDSRGAHKGNDLPLSYRHRNLKHESRRHSKKTESDLNTMSDESMYTYLTGQPRRATEVR